MSRRLSGAFFGAILSVLMLCAILFYIWACIETGLFVEEKLGRGGDFVAILLLFGGIGSVAGFLASDGNKP